MSKFYVNKDKLASLHPAEQLKNVKIRPKVRQQNRNPKYDQNYILDNLEFNKLLICLCIVLLVAY